MDYETLREYKHAYLRYLMNKILLAKNISENVKRQENKNCSQVVANAVAALSEINEASPSGQPLVEMNAQTINKLLTALNECTEWGQVFILDSLANYSPKDDREAQSICERITPRLAHANAAVVLSAVKVDDKQYE